MRHKHKNIEGVPNRSCAYCFCIKPQTKMVMGVKQFEGDKEIWLCSDGSAIYDTCEGKYYDNSHITERRFWESFRKINFN